MKSIETHTRRLALASLVLFLAHLPLLRFVRGEFTDGVLQSVYFDAPIFSVAEGAGPPRYVPPLFPITLYTLSSVGVDRIVAGRLVSMAAYAVTAFGLGWCATQIGTTISRGDVSGRKIGWMAWAFWALSPMANRWSFHCMSDMLFCSLATLSLGCFLESSRTGARNPGRCWALGNFLGVTSSICRYQGLALLAASLGAWLFIRSSGNREAKGARSGWVAASFMLWIVGAFVLASQASVHGKQFSERSQFPAGVYTGFAIAGFRYLPYAVTPPLFLLAVFGILKTFQTGFKSRIWILLGVLGGLGGLVLQTMFQSFQFRYGLPLLPWLCILAAIGTLGLPKRVQLLAATVALLWLGVMSGAIILYQRETFGDLEKASRSAGLASKSSGGKVWAREPYDNEGKYRNVKTSVWSGVPVAWLEEPVLGRVSLGDMLIDSNVYPIPAEYLTTLRTKWRLAVIGEAVSETIPLFPGEILWVKYPTPRGEEMIRGTSDPNLMPFRFQRQFYSTVVYRIEAKTANSNGVNH